MDVGSRAMQANKPENPINFGAAPYSVLILL
jgi:hypothetical protein